MHADPFSQTVINNDFEFQQTLSCHSGAVRCLCTLASVDTLVSGSIDTSCKLYSLDKSNGKYSFEKELTYHDSFVLAVEPE
jgi:WD40 repeat protein